MSVSIETLKRDRSISTQDEDLPEEDGEPLESDWHRLAMTLLIDVTSWHLRERDDFFVGGNMYMYYGPQNRKNKKQVRGPDYFLVWGVSLGPARRQWLVWKEGHFPDVIIELGSPTTIKTDKTTKKRTYERTFRTHEYFIYDPATEKLFGWRLHEGRYQRIEPNEKGWLWCEELGLWLGTWRGRFQLKEEVFPRFFDKDGRMVPTTAEAEKQQKEAEKLRADAEKQRADDERRQKEAEKQRADDERRQKEVEKQRADDEMQRADDERRQKEAEKQRADDEMQRADDERRQKEAEKQRADIAEAELARLRAQNRRRRN